MRNKLSKSNIIIVIGTRWFYASNFKKKQKFKEVFLWNKFRKLWFFNE